MLLKHVFLIKHELITLQLRPKHNITLLNKDYQNKLGSSDEHTVKTL